MQICHGIFEVYLIPRGWGIWLVLVWFDFFIFTFYTGGTLFIPWGLELDVHCNQNRASTIREQ